MARRRVSIADVVAVLGIGVACIPILLALLPYLEESRGEARIMQAYADVRRLHEQTTPPERETVLDEKDPWGQPYRLVPLENQTFRVVSSGANLSSSTNELDGDDISSDLTTSPSAAILAKKRMQLIAALCIAAAAWVLLAVLYMRWRWKSRSSD